MSDFQKRLDEYQEKKLSASSSSYTISISIDNNTDTSYDDSIFAGSYEGGGGPLVVGFQWPKNSQGSINANVETCLVGLGGKLFNGTEVLDLPAYTASELASDECWVNLGWVINYVSAKAVASRKTQTRPKP